MQHAACGLYAFCREADDLVDEGENPKRALKLLHNRLDRIYEGKPQYVATDRVPRKLFTPIKCRESC